MSASAIVFVLATLGADVVRLAPTELYGLNATLEPIRAKHRLPALAAIVVTADGPKATGATGRRKAGDPTPVSIDDAFHLGSCTKAMTAWLLAQEVEAGKLSWETTLAEALPDLAEGMDPAYKRVTIRQLLAHRSGLSGRTEPKGKSLLTMHAMQGPLDGQRREYLKLILAEPPASTPGTKFEYSNRNFTVAGAISERIAGKPWEELIRERLFVPLGMTTAGFGAMGSAGRLDQPWQHTSLLGASRPVGPGPLSDNPPLIGPAGRVHMSLPDWGKWASEQLRGDAGRSTFLKAATYAELHRSAQGQSYAFGWATTEKPERSYEHDGSNTMNYATIRVFPDAGLAVLVATNQGGARAEAACHEAAELLRKSYGPAR